MSSHVGTNVDRDLYAERASRGARLLDEETPDWFAKIKIAHLCMRNEEKCVLAQVYGSYSFGLNVLNIEPLADDYVLYGFDVSVNIFQADSHYKVLDDVWIEEVNKRTAALSEEK